MKKIFDAFSRLGQKIKSNISREFLTYLVFLSIAVVIWYLNALNKDYNAELTFAIKYTDLPEDRVLANIPEKHLTLTVNAQGFTLLKYRWLKHKPIMMEAGYQTLRSVSRSAQGEYYIATQTAFDRIAAQNPDVVLSRITPDTLKFLFSETIRKEVAVKPLLQFQYEKGFLPKGAMRVEPGKVTVTGPKTLVDTMQYVYTRRKVFKKLKDTLHASVDLQPIHQLRYSAGEVNITQTIERHTEATISVPIEPVNLPKELTMKVFPGTVTVNCMVAISDYEKLQPYMFRAVVDYAAVRDAKDNQSKAKVTLLRTPDYVTDVKYNPKNVDFIIEK